MKYIIPLLTAMPLFLMAQDYGYTDLNSKVAAMQQKMASGLKERNVTISPEMKARAEKLNSTFEGRSNELEQWKSSMDYVDGKVVFGGKHVDKGKSKKPQYGSFAENERIYIFISSSVPRETLTEYARTIDALGVGNRVVMVLRGCIGGCEKIKPTLAFINKVVTDDGAVKDGLKAQVWIDPLLFRKYKITRSPTVVYARGVNKDIPQLSEGLESNLKTQPIINKSEGDWSLEYHLKELYKQTKSVTLQKTLAQFEKNEFYQGKSQ